MLFQNTKQYFLALLIPIALALTGCGGGSSNSSDDISNLEQGALISASFIDPGISSILSEVDSYRIIYATVDTKGNKVKASGLLSIPRKSSGEKSPLFSYQHGTIFKDSDAPSVHPSTIETIAILLAGRGYIVSSPDYLGYSESTSILHPYIHAESLASASIDMLRASKSYLESKNILLNNQLFLAGYSEGGYATIALQKEIQEFHSSEFTVTASAAGAGPYDLSASAEFLANKAINNNPSYMNFVVKAYDEIYELNSIDEMYKAPYRNIINTSFDGSRSSSQINGLLTSTTADLFETDFLTLLQGSGAHPIKDAFAENDIYDWKPTSPTRFFHGINDDIVPYSNSTTALSKMQSNGATDVSLISYPTCSHTTCAVDFVDDAYSFFSSYATDL